MREGWCEVPLGDVFALTSTRAREVAEPPVFSVTKYNGVVLAADYFDKRIASESIANYKVLEAEDWAYSTIHIDEGSIARNNLGLRGVVSPMYTTMRFAAAEHDPRYYELLLRTGHMLARYKDVQQGSINRRRSLPWKVFCGIKVTVPALREQRRIVDLIGALDDAIAAAEASATATDALSQRSRDALPAGPVRPIGEVLVGIESGTSTKPVGGDGEKVFVMTLAAIRPGRFHGAEIKDVGAAVLPRKARLMESDLLITRSNTPDRVGYVCVARGVPDNTYIPDLVWRLVPDERQVTKDYLEQALSSTRLREAITGSASGTSQSMRKINKAGFSRIEVPIPGIEEQNAYVAPLRQLARVRKEYDSLLAGLLTLRSNLIGVLLAGEHEIPDSYDDLMGVAS